MLCANLEGASLVSCNFDDPAGSAANMEGVNLKEATLEGSNMARVNLRVATVKNANLKSCDLRGAVLAGADLEVLIESKEGQLDCAESIKRVVHTDVFNPMGAPLILKDFFLCSVV